MNDVNIISLSGYVPFYATEGAACFDIATNEDVYLEKGQYLTVGTGLYIEVPKDHVMFIFPRSGTVAKRGLTIANSPGVIDSDYRGEIKLVLHNIHELADIVKKGERVAQGFIMPFKQFKFNVVDSLSETERGSGGFGHTGTQ